MSANENKLLVIGHIWPEPAATAAGQRMIHLLNFFKESGYHITFGCTASKTQYSENLETLGIQEKVIQLNDSGFDAFVRELAPDLVVFDRFMTEEQYGWRIAETVPDCIRILNTEDLHSLRWVRGRSIKENKEFKGDQWLKADITKRELASIFRSDLSLIISQFEMELLRERARVFEEILFYLPLFYGKEEKDHSQITATYTDRSDFVFIGNGKHLPNLDAINWLKEAIWPKIRSELPEAILHIYGAYLPSNILTLNCPKEGFLVHGYIEDSMSVLNKARLNLAPLRFGAGLKGKIMEAMRTGTPSVCTDTALEGIETDDTKINSMLSDPVGFAREAVELYRNRKKWEDKQAYDAGILAKNFDREQFENRLKQKLYDISEDLDKHRLNNPVGAMLMHHTMASTRYMSKWIEVKNQSK